MLRSTNNRSNIDENGGNHEKRIILHCLLFFANQRQPPTYRSCSFLKGLSSTYNPMNQRLVREMRWEWILSNYFERYWNTGIQSRPAAAQKVKVNPPVFSIRSTLPNVLTLDRMHISNSTVRIVDLRFNLLIVFSTRARFETFLKAVVFLDKVFLEPKTHDKTIGGAMEEEQWEYCQRTK